MIPLWRAKSRDCLPTMRAPVRTVLRHHTITVLTFTVNPRHLSTNCARRGISHDGPVEFETRKGSTSTVSRGCRCFGSASAVPDGAAFFSDFLWGLSLMSPPPPPCCIGAFSPTRATCFVHAFYHASSKLLGHDTGGRVSYRVIVNCDGCAAFRWPL